MPSIATADPWLCSYPGFMPIPTMLSRSEIDYLHWLTSTQFSGRGRILDLGCFFGGSTMPLATGLAANVSANHKPNILTYDSFIMDADTVPRFPVGLGDGDSFRPIFETYLREHLPRITIREGWLPTSLKPGDDRRLYPEQEPIEILFIDIAKLWPVHDTILRVFGPHLIPGVSTIIQQDFKHHGTYWLGIHMYQLRDCFEPMHDITGGASVSFRYKGGLETELQALISREDIPPASIAQTWRDVDDYWLAWERSNRGPSATRLIMHLAAATHLADAGRAEEAIEFLQLFESEFRALLPLPEGGGWGEGLLLPQSSNQLDSPTPSLSSDLPLLQADFLSALRRISQTTNHPAASSLLARHEIPDTAATWRDSRRRAAVNRCLAAGHKTIALYGAGRHTAELLASGWPHSQLTIAAILDDYPTAKEIRGIPILRPASMPRTVQAVIISSEASEDALFQAATAALRAVPIFRIYS